VRILVPLLLLVFCTGCLKEEYNIYVNVENAPPIPLPFSSIVNSILIEIEDSSGKDTIRFTRILSEEYYWRESYQQMEQEINVVRHKLVAKYLSDKNHVLEVITVYSAPEVFDPFGEKANIREILIIVYNENIFYFKNNIPPDYLSLLDVLIVLPRLETDSVPVTDKLFYTQRKGLYHFDLNSINSKLIVLK
jgi:hypothetical protein